MTQTQLTLDTLKDFDVGKAAVAWEKAMAQAVRDCIDRSGETKARKVTLEAVITPLPEQDGDVVDTYVEFVIKTNLPPKHTSARPLVTDRKGRMYFQPLAPDNPRQTTIE